ISALSESTPDRKYSISRSLSPCQIRRLWENVFRLPSKLSLKRFRVALEILVAGSANKTRQKLAEILISHGYTVRRCLPEELPAQTRDRLPALLILLDDLPRIHTLIHQFKKDEAAQGVP